MSYDELDERIFEQDEPELEECDCIYCTGEDASRPNFGYNLALPDFDGTYPEPDPGYYGDEVYDDGSQSLEDLLFAGARTLDAGLAQLLELSYQRGYRDGLAETSEVTYDDAFEARVVSVLDQLDEWAPFIEGEVGGLNARFDSLVEAVADIVEGQDERLDITEADAPVLEAVLDRLATVEARQAELDAQIEELEEELDAR